MEIVELLNEVYQEVPSWSLLLAFSIGVLFATVANSLRDLGVRAVLGETAQLVAAYLLVAMVGFPLLALASLLVGPHLVVLLLYFGTAAFLAGRMAGRRSGMK
jgi:hypothetical protein